MNEAVADMTFVLRTDPGFLLLINYGSCKDKSSIRPLSHRCSSSTQQVEGLNVVLARVCKGPCT